MNSNQILNNNEPDPKKKKTLAAIGISASFLTIFVILFIIFGGLSQCKSCKSAEDTRIIRTPSDVTDFSVIFKDGEAILYWVDSDDPFLEYIEITWDPDGGEPVRVEKGEGKFVIRNFPDRKITTFTVRAVDQWGNKSLGVTGGSGHGYKQTRLPGTPPAEIIGIKGTPKVGQATLSWTNLNAQEYEYIEITFEPDQKSVIRVPKGANSRTLYDLTNGIEHTFYVAAVDSQGNRKPVPEVGLFISDHPTSRESVSGRPVGGQITLVWRDSLDPSHTHLVIAYNPGGEKPIIVPLGEETKIFTGLDDNTEYDFTVYGADADGNLRPLTGVIMITPSVPSPVEEDLSRYIVKGKPVTGRITLNWNDPDMAGLTHVEIFYKPDVGDNLRPGPDDTPVIVMKGDETRAFSGLGDNKEYSFIAYGVDGDGNRKPISGVTLSTPRAPQRIIARPVSGQITLNWNDPQGTNLDRVEITYRPGGERVPVTNPNRRGSHTFTGLSDNTEYEFFVNAVTNDRNVYAVPEVSVSVPALSTIRGRPVDGRLSLAWNDPAGINVSHVEIVYTPGGQTARRITTGMENQTFTGLRDGVEHTFTVYAVDNTGNRFPVTGLRFVTPEVPVAAAPPPEPPPPPPVIPGPPGQLYWRPTGDSTFGESTIHALAFGETEAGTRHWVAGGTDGKIAYSNDLGLNWTQVGSTSFGSFTVNAITYANGRWLAVGNSGRMAYSGNAVSWTAVRNTHFDLDQNINTVVFANDRWAAGGSNGIVIWSTDNGVTWEETRIESFGTSSVNAIAFHQNRWVAGGSEGKMAYSNTNGQTWTAIDSTFGDNIINMIIFDKGRWMAGGYGRQIAWSTNGINWRTLRRPFYILGMAYNGTRWIAGGQEGRMAWTFDGGDRWTIDEPGGDLFGQSWVYAIAYGTGSGGTGFSGRWLSGGQNGILLYADE